MDELGVEYVVNLPFDQITSSDRIGVLGVGAKCLDGYQASNSIIAGIGLMTHPSEWPNLMEEYPIATYLQHSTWAVDVYRAYYGDKCQAWAAGIDTERWRPSKLVTPKFDFLIYDKIRWDYHATCEKLKNPILAHLSSSGFSYKEIRYGNYDPKEYAEALMSCRAMIFLCEHESQGIAYQECLSSGIPVLAWDQGWCLDPNRFAWGQPSIPASSVPFFDDRCGRKFGNAFDFPHVLEDFLSAQRKGLLVPREFVLGSLTLKLSAEKFLSFFE